MASPPPFPPGTQPPPEQWSWAHVTNTIFANALNAPFPTVISSFLEEALPRTLAVAAAFFFRLRATMGEQIARQLDLVIAQSDPYLRNIAARGLSDYFGVPVNANELLARGIIPNSTHARLADLVLNTMFRSFSPTSAPTPQQGFENAKRMMEFSLGSALEGWLEGQLGAGAIPEMLPRFDQLDDIIANNLGLSRMSRRALAPIFDAWIVEPFRQYIAMNYRNALPSESVSVRMLNRGVISEQEYFDILSRHGWSHERAAELRVTLSKELTESHLKAAVRAGLLEEGEAREFLRAGGYTAGSANAILTLWREDRLASYREAIAVLARDMLRDREIEQSEFQGMCQQAGLTSAETSALSALAMMERARPARMPRATMEAAFVAGIADGSELRGLLELEGFSSRNADIIMGLAVARKERIETAAAERQTRIEQARRRVVSRSTWEELFRRGLINETRLGAELGNHGVTGEAQQLLILRARQLKAEHDAAIARRALPTPGIVAGRSSIEEAYVRGLVEEADLIAFLTSAGIAPAEVDLLVQLANLERQEAQERARLAAERRAAQAAADPPAV